MDLTSYFVEILELNLATLDQDLVEYASYSVYDYDISIGQILPMLHGDTLALAIF